MIIRLDIPSRIQTLEETDKLVYRLAKAVGLDEGSRDDILTAVHEALVNAIVHGNKEQEGLTSRFGWRSIRISLRSVSGTRGVASTPTASRIHFHPET